MKSLLLDLADLAERVKALESKVNTRVIFSVARKGLGRYGQYEHYTELGQIITYTDVIANVGQGMDPNTGIFEAPVSGIYSFSFSALSDSREALNGYATRIKVIKNLYGAPGSNYFESKFDIFQDAGTKAFMENLSFSWMMSLYKGDKIHLAMNTWGAKLLTTDDHPLYFNGQLLEAKVEGAYTSTSSTLFETA